MESKKAANAIPAPEPKILGSAVKPTKKGEILLFILKPMP